MFCGYASFRSHTVDVTCDLAIFVMSNINANCMEVKAHTGFPV